MSWLQPLGPLGPLGILLILLDTDQVKPGEDVSNLDTPTTNRQKDPSFVGLSPAQLPKLVRFGDSKPEPTPQDQLGQSLDGFKIQVSPIWAPPNPGRV